MTDLQRAGVSERAFAPKLAAFLAQHDAVRRDDLARARAAAEIADKRLDQALLDLGLLTEAALREVLAQQFGVADALPGDLPQAPVLSDELSPTYLAAAGALPLNSSSDTLALAMVDPFDDFTATAISLKTGRSVVRRRISRQRFEAAMADVYGAAFAPDTNTSGDEATEANTSDVELLRDAASDAPVIRFVQDALRAAVGQNASDIHLRPMRGGAEMLFRVQGELIAQTPPEPRQFASIISRLKILAGLDISERRLPQDGRIRANVAGRPVDIRISTMPHIHGEAAVLRLLSRELAVSGLGELGFSDAIQGQLESLFTAADGLILVTGPTGSGKSTTLHAALKRLIRPDLNVVTIEDPVEYRIDGAAQIQVDEKIGLTFPRVLRSLLRQDPDIILVGEIRDAETAKIAVQAALTGHLVLATLHTNSALAAVPRLVDMGVEPYLLGAVLRGVLAQRLVRRLCTHCGGSGCEPCNHSGYAGRVAIGELLLLDAELSESLARSLELPVTQQDRLRRTGYRPLCEDAEDRVRNGEIAAADLSGLIDVS
jgi:general secretion pathway protein E